MSVVYISNILVEKRVFKFKSFSNSGSVTTSFFFRPRGCRLTCFQHIATVKISQRVKCDIG